MEDHNARVSHISDQVRSFHEQKKQYRIYHGTTSTTRRTKLSRDRIIDTSLMNHVLEIDPETRTALVEPNVSMEKLVNATLDHGLVPLVVMEFPAITVGGGFAGTAGESSSFRHGLFDNTISGIEIVLADGEIVDASEDVRPDLFNAAAGTFGTLGVITLLRVRLAEAKKYVRLTYMPIHRVQEAVQIIEELSDHAKVEYLEGILFHLNKGVIISGRLTDVLDPALRLVTYRGPWDPWFYLHAEKIYHRASAQPVEELVPIKDYLFRYDRGAFWAGKYAFRYFLAPFNALTRRLLDGFMKTEVMYHALHKSHLADQYIVQDIGFPYATVDRFVDYVHAAFGFYPLWLCPLKMKEDLSLRPRRISSVFADGARSPGRMINVGLWGPGPKRYEDFVRANREIERETAGLGGLKCFYAQAFYTADEFWTLYDKEWYDTVRTKYKAAGLRSAYEKVNVDLTARIPASELNWRQWAYERLKEQWPVRGVYGALQTLLSKEYLFG